MKNGIIGILCNSKKVVDLKITNSLPIIALENTSYLVVENRKQNISGFQHLSIPSDLSIHLTRQSSNDKESKHMFFNSPRLESLFTDQEIAICQLFTYVSPPINYTPVLKGKWEQAALISPLPDGDYDPNQTRVFIDFFVHTENDLADLPYYSFAIEGMRLAYDRTGCIFGPFHFDGLQRKPRVKSNLFFSIRYGYIDMPIEQNCFVYIQYPIRRQNSAE